VNQVGIQAQIHARRNGSGREAMIMPDNVVEKDFRVLLALQVGEQIARRSVGDDAPDKAKLIC
jgi:hypothetical protein